MSETTIERQIADALRDARIARGLSMREAAKRAGVATSYWSKVESSVRVGNVGCQTIARMASAVGLTFRIAIVPTEVE